MSAATPRVWILLWEDRAYVDGPDGGHLWLDTPAWFAWLDMGMTARFAYPLFDPAKGYIVGVMTVRKERRGRGGAYWTAYRRVGTKLRKVYLGRTPTVTQGRLAASARALLAATAGATRER
jgi:LuxR family maltose regulon positive regulatory protein